ncbi:MAG TPA: phage tail tape measure protein, partial [Bacteroidia bacterium]|nr:phage tail tape measure protein [Bacteroidia bacterium]
MGAALDKFAAKAQGALSRNERLFNKLTPTLSETSKQFLSFASSAAIAAAAVSVAKFSAESLMDYESEIANLSAITGTSGANLDKFKSKIQDVASQTKESSIEVAKAFTRIGNNSPQLLSDANALSEVTKQSIILSQASKMQLGPAADYLTQIMNQFNTPASEAGKTIDLLAGGMVVGSTDINKVAEAMLIFGGAAGQANISLAESVTAIEAISDKVTDMSRLGTQFRNIFSRMEHASVLDKTAVEALHKAGVNMSVLESKTKPFIEKLKELKKLQKIKGGLVAVFNEENQQSLIPLLNSVDKYQEMYEKLNKESGGSAAIMAAKNNATLAKAIEQVKNSFVNLLTGSTDLSEGMKNLRTVLLFVRDNMGDIVKWGLRILAFFAVWKVLIIASRIALISYNVVAAAVAAANFLLAG